VRPAPPSAAADPSDALKKLAAMQPAPLQPAQMTRIYVGNVYRELSEAEIQTVFEAFGPVRSCKFIPNPENGVGKHKGFGFIEYYTPPLTYQLLSCIDLTHVSGTWTPQLRTLQCRQ
jgi:poly(U)-binding-splicing factor PUF60